MKNIKEWDWKKIGWRTLQVIFIIIMNCGSIAWFTMNCIDIGEPFKLANERVVQMDFFSALPIYYKMLTIGIAILGWFVSYSFIKLLYKNHREDKNFKKQNEMDNKKLEKLADKIMKGSN